jgi:predicted nucleic acid-binding protein
VSLVLDASVTVAWFFEDERTPDVVAVLDRVSRDGADVPPVWRLEVVKALQSAVRRGRTVVQARDQALSQLLELTIITDESCDAHCWGRALALADVHGMTIHDASYLELATRRGLPLATRDQKLRAAAHAEGVQLLA